MQTANIISSTINKVIITNGVGAVYGIMEMYAATVAGCLPEDLQSAFLKGFLNGFMMSGGYAALSQLAGCIPLLKLLVAAFDGYMAYEDFKSARDAFENGDYLMGIIYAISGMAGAYSAATTSAQTCFTGETLVATENGQKRIDEIEIGDKVWAYNVETGETELKEVTKVYIHSVDEVLHLYTDEGTIDTTTNHPFYVIGKGWVAAGDLEIGDEVYNLDGTTSTVTGSELEKLDEPILVYNLEVEDFHSYFVGDVPVLVHNYQKGGGCRHFPGPKGRESMYTYEERMKAVKLYIETDFNENEVISRLGYPSPNSLYAWYEEYSTAGDLPKKAKKKPRFTQQQIDYAVSYYYAHNSQAITTVRALGYPSRVTLKKWIELGRKVKSTLMPTPCKNKNTVVKYTSEQKRDIVIECLDSHVPIYKIAAKYSVSKALISKWKKDLLGKRPSVNMKQNDVKNIPHPENKEDLSKEHIAELQSEVAELNKQIYHLQMQLDAMRVADKILKKESGINLDELKNSEKADVISALKEQYRLKDLLALLKFAKSSYFYQERAKNAPDKYVLLRQKVKTIFSDSGKTYGYRRVNALVKRDGLYISDKVVIRIMKEESLTVFVPKRKKYSSYKGELCSFTPNLIKRDFHSSEPNRKWLTDISEFALPAGKVYLSPIIDCFDGIVTSWSIGESPNAALANSSLKNAIMKLKQGEHPVIHSDRGCHYQWPEWIKLTEQAGLNRSMSRKGCSPDNSACEGFFGRLKNEMFYNRSWHNVSIEEFISKLNSYILWYNEKRIKMSLGALSPIEYRQKLGLSI